MGKMILRKGGNPFYDILLQKEGGEVPEKPESRLKERRSEPTGGGLAEGGA